MELVSIIVPVYNVEKYLPECLDSILASTYQNLEIIVVDDGSPDNCPQICDEYALKDPRIHVIHQENQGLVGARNTGLSVANGTYIAFVDSDDAISPYLYEALVTATEAENADIAACEYTQDKNTLTMCLPQSQYTYTVLPTFEEQLSAFVRAPSIRKITWTSGFSWNKLYRKEKIRQHFNNQCLIGEDLRFNWDYIRNSPCKMVIVPDILYFYRQNDQSIMAEYYGRAAVIEKAVALAENWRYIAENSSVSSTLKEYLYARVVYLMQGILRRICFAKKERLYSEYIRETRVYMRKHIDFLFQQTDTYNKKVFLGAWLCCYLFPVWKITIKLVSLR